MTRDQAAAEEVADAERAEPWDQWPEVDQLRYQLRKVRGAWRVAMNGWRWNRATRVAAEAERDRLRQQVAQVVLEMRGVLNRDREPGFPYAVDRLGEVEHWEAALSKIAAPPPLIPPERTDQ